MLYYKLWIACDFSVKNLGSVLIYFVLDQKKSGGAYQTISGQIKKIDERQIVLKNRINIDCVLDINGQIYSRTSDKDIDFD